MMLYVHLAGAVFNLLCGDRDEATMRKIELYFPKSKMTEVTLA